MASICISHRIHFRARVAALSEKGSIQHGYIKWGTHAWVFSQTLAIEKSKNEIKQSNRRRLEDSSSSSSSSILLTGEVPSVGRDLYTDSILSVYYWQAIDDFTFLLYNHPPTLHNTTARMISQLQKSNRTHMIIFIFYTKK